MFRPKSSASLLGQPETAAWLSPANDLSKPVAASQFSNPRHWPQLTEVADMIPGTDNVNARPWECRGARIGRTWVLERSSRLVRKARVGDGRLARPRFKV